MSKLVNDPCPLLDLKRNFEKLIHLPLPLFCHSLWFCKSGAVFSPPLLSTEIPFASSVDAF